MDDIVDIHIYIYALNILIFALMIPLFLASVLMDPGYLKPRYDFRCLVELALDLGLHLDSLCCHCEVIKSDTSFHCTICDKCVELFDHHCPFINNCLGHRNYKYFLGFISLYSLYYILLLIDSSIHLVSVSSEYGFEKVYKDSMFIICWILILLHFPILFN